MCLKRAHKQHAPTLKYPLIPYPPHILFQTDPWGHSNVQFVIVQCQHQSPDHMAREGMDGQHMVTSLVTGQQHFDVAKGDSSGHLMGTDWPALYCHCATFVLKDWFSEAST